MGKERITALERNGHVIPTTQIVIDSLSGIMRDAKDDIALLIETAHSYFSTLRALSDGRLAVVINSGQGDGSAHQAAADIKMALAKEFLFNVVRARRIAEHAGDKLSVEKAKRRSFVNSLAHVVDVRDVNEHGFDRNSKASSLPRQHLHANDSASVDETSLIILLITPAVPRVA